MRPRELVLSGFRSYESETRFCWEGRSLVGIVGPIGSGKSTILDGIALALYGQTPRSGKKTGSLINQRREVAQVSLTFEVEGVVYKAVRSLRSKGSQHALYRLDGDDEVLLSDKMAEMGEEIESLLGLDFAAFQRSVLLAQNQFAEFLEATKGERDQVLKGVFGFDRLDAMRAEAKERLDALGNRLAVLEDRRATAASDKEDLDRRRTELEAAEQRAAALEELRGPFEEAKEIIAASERRTQEAEADAKRLDALADRIPTRERAEAVLTAAGDSAGRVAAAEQALAEATEHKSAAAVAADEALAGVGGRQGLDRAADLVAAWRSAAERSETSGVDLGRAEQRLAEARERAGGGSSAVEAAEAEATRTWEAEAAALAEVEAAEAAVLQAQQAHMAHAIRADLVVGEPCPVCEQTVASVPDGEVPDTIEQARAAAAAAKTRRSDASVAAREAADALTLARAAFETAAGAVTEAEAGLAAARETRERALAAAEQALAAVGEVVGEGDPGSALDAIRATATNARSALEEATAAETKAREALDRERAAAREAETSLGALRTELAAVIGALDLDVTIEQDSASVSAALHDLREAWVARRTAATEAVTTATEAVAAGRSALADLLEAAGLGVADDLAEVVAAAVAERSGKEAEVALLEKRLADLETLAADESGLVSQKALLDRIHGDLAPAKFLRHVLDERRQVLGDLASEHFETLSAGRYRFDDDGEFEVVDLTWAEDTREASSLSGGETFLASLALALALAEIVSREGGRLDAFFLDEGFGSLDPEHLDLAMSGVERLVTTGPDRLVVVVSHVPALNERIEDLIVLDRDPTTGDTRVVSGGGCP